MADDSRIYRIALAAYAATVVLYLIGYYLTPYRSWGINGWGYFPVWSLAIPAGLAIAGVLLGKVLSKQPGVAQESGARTSGTNASGDQALRTQEPGEKAERNKGTGKQAKRAKAGSSRTVEIAAIVLGGCGLAVLMFLLRGRTHFLGDGYQNLNRLAQGFPVVKDTEIGTEWLLLLVRGVTGSSTADALLAYQIVSVVAGGAFAGLVIWSAIRLFERTGQRLVFGAGILGSGFMLLFFGYVEHYAPVAAATGGVTLLGVLALRGTVSRWIPVVCAGLAIFFHLIALALVPAMVYLLLHDRRIGRAFGKSRRSTKVLALVGIVVIGVGGFIVAAGKSYFLRFAVLSPFPGEFTPPGYSLFSPAHLLDFANLLLLLAPAGLLGLALWWRAGRVDRRGESSSYGFLAVLAVSTGLAVFVLDPKLGMPRDWDLFSLPGIPIAVLLYLYLLERVGSAAVGVRVATLAAALGMIGLAPRVAREIDPEASIAFVSDCIELDPAKNRNVYMALYDYYLEAGMQGLADSTRALWDSRYPERRLILQGQQMKRSGDLRGAQQAFRQALAVSPLYFDAYNNLGDVLLAEKRYDSAISMLRIAEGLNPGSFSVLHNLASAYFYKGELERAVGIWEAAVRLDSTNYQPYFNLMRIYQARGEVSRYVVNLERAARCENAPTTMMQELIDQYLKAGAYTRAKEAMREGLARGVDTAWVASRLQGIPSGR